MTAISKTTETIHIGSTDERDCGSKEFCRRWTTNETEVTCPACKARMSRVGAA